LILLDGRAGPPMDVVDWALLGAAIARA